MKPFNLQEAKAGKEVVTNLGAPVRMIDFNYNPASGHPIRIVGIVEFKSISCECLLLFTEEGECITTLANRGHTQLFMKNALNALNALNAPNAPSTTYFNMFKSIYTPLNLDSHN